MLYRGSFKKEFVSILTLVILTGCSVTNIPPKDIDKLSEDNETIEKLNQVEESNQTISKADDELFKNVDQDLKPYYVNGKWYYPTRVDIGETFEGVASWYGPDFHGKKTSNGENYDMYDFTAAHRTLPFNTMLRVTNLKNSKSTIVRVNDRGPFVQNRIIDLSFAGAKDIDIINYGTALVKLEVVGFNREVVFDRASEEKINPIVKSTVPKVDIEEKLTPIQEIAPLIEDSSKEIKKPKNITKESLSDGISDNMVISTFSVQIGAFSSRENANTLANRYGVVEDRYRAVVKEAKVDRKSVYKVMFVGFKSYEEARDFINKEKFSDAFIISEIK